jgi:CheY-like chemotaxis protein
MGYIPRKINVSVARAGRFNMSAKGLRVFVVEDEPMIRMLLLDMLGDLGHTLAAEAGDIDKALEIAQSADFDLAILDVNLRGVMVTPVAKLIIARGRQIIFATGYGSEGLPEEFRNFPTLPKPFEIKALAEAIDEIFGSRNHLPI